MYVDGQLAGQMIGSNADAGGVMGVNGSAYLCGRSDNNTDRHFTGNLAYLGNISHTALGLA